MLERLYRFVRPFVRLFRIRRKSGEDNKLDKQLVSSLTRSKVPTVAQLKKVPVYLTSAEKRVILFLILIIILASGWWGYDYYKHNVSTSPSTGGVLTEALIGQPKFINPILAQTSDTDLDLTRLVYSGLMKYDTDLNLVTDLAESYAVDEEQKVYTFQMKDGLMWQDGEPLTVDDVIFTVRSIQNSEWQSPLLISFKGISVDKIDERTVAFNLPEPFAPFLTLMTTGILPKHVWEDIPPSSAKLAELNVKPIGSGGWKFKELAKDKMGNIHSYTLVVNGLYHDEMPYITEMVFKFFPDFISAIDALNQNQVMSLSFLPNDLVPAVEGEEKYNLYELELPQYSALFFNQKQNELLKSKSVRQALAYSTDEARLVSEGLQNHAIPIYSPILPNQPGYLASGDPYDYNPDKARELLKEVGWTIGDDGLQVKDDELLAISITTVEHSENQIIATLLKEMWEDVGIDVAINEISAAEIQSTIIRNSDYDVLHYGEIIGADPDPFPFWHSSQAEHPGLNLAQFIDGTTDILLEEARQTNNIETRIQKYEEFQKIIARELPAIFLYSPTYTYVHDKRIQNFSSSGLIFPADRFNSLSTWYLKTKRVINR